MRFSTTTTFMPLPPIQCLKSEMPSATMITAQRNSVKPMGQKQERDMPSPKQIAHMHRLWRSLKQDQLQFGLQPDLGITTSPLNWVYRSIQYIPERKKCYGWQTTTKAEPE